MGGDPGGHRRAVGRVARPHVDDDGVGPGRGQVASAAACAGRRWALMTTTSERSAAATRAEATARSLPSWARRGGGRGERPQRGADAPRHGARGDVGGAVELDDVSVGEQRWFGQGAVDAERSLGRLGADGRQRRAGVRRLVRLHAVRRWTRSHVRSPAPDCGARPTTAGRPHAPRRRPAGRRPARPPPPASTRPTHASTSTPSLSGPGSRGRRPRRAPATEAGMAAGSPAPPMSSVPVTTSPVNPSSPPSRSVTIRRLTVAGCSASSAAPTGGPASPPGLRGDCGPERHQLAVPQGVRRRRQCGRARCESTTVAVPGEVLAHAATPAPAAPT